MWWHPRPAGPLAGLRVLEMGSLVAGPFCTRLLADYGGSPLRLPFIVDLGLLVPAFLGLLMAASSKPPATKPAGPSTDDLHRLYDQKNYTDAINLYKKALEIRPSALNVRTDMGTAMFYQNRFDEAITEFQETLKSDPKNAQALFNLGVAMLHGKNDP